MENGIKDSVCAFADYLDKEGCEFVLVVRDGATGVATALMSEQSVGMMAGVFDKSKEVYETFKTAESWMASDGFSGYLCLN